MPTIDCPSAINATAPHWPEHESQARSIVLWLLHSFTILTINADGHDLMCQFHKPVDEKRMLVILPPDCYDHWLKSRPQDNMDFMRALPYTESASQC